MFKKNNKVLPDRISWSTSLEHVECYVIMSKITPQNFKVKQFVQPQYLTFTKYKFVCHMCIYLYLLNMQNKNTNVQDKAICPATIFNIYKV